MNNNHKLLILPILCFLFLSLNLKAQNPTVLNYIKNKSEIKEGGSAVFNYQGDTYVISVVPVVVGTKTEIACKTVGSAKAKKEMLSFIQGTDITSYAELITSESVSHTLEGTKVESNQVFVEKIKETVVGTINGTIPLGGWFSDDKSIYYFALYQII